ncbi:MAG: hypothetical protein RL020_1645 [Pseudomonadota bacterium]|jgi:hypothetical protein
MTNLDTTRSWIYAAGVTALFLVLLAMSSPAQADAHFDLFGSTSYQSVGKMQLARGDNVAATPQRRTYEVADAIAQPAMEPDKDAKKDRKGIQGPAGKTPTEKGPAGKNSPQQNDAYRIPGDVPDGCSKYLRCSGD